MAEQFDVVVVGARVAGSPLAALLARRGVKVAVLEQATFPQPTLSSHMLQADALAFFARLGVLDRIRATGAPFMTRTDTRLGDFRFVADFPTFPGSVGGAACIRRQVLDPILADTAVEAGADVRMGAKVTGLLEEHGRVAGVRFVHRGTESRIRARLVVGADGRESLVAKHTGARRYNVTRNERWYYWTYFEGADPAAASTFVFHRWDDRHIFAGPADNGLYIVGVSPQKGEKAAFRADRQESLLDHVRSCEPVAEALAEAKVADKIYGILRFDGYFREPSGPGWVLLGDSGHFKDPAAGRGIADAFHQAEHLAPAIVRALRGPDSELDRATAAFGRWRDRQYAEYYWLATDLGREGDLPPIVAEVAANLYAKGEIGAFLDLFSHRAGPSQAISPGRVLAATARRLASPESGRGAFVRELGATLREEVRRRRRSSRPVFEPPAEPADAGRRTRAGSGTGPTERGSRSS
ncbi:NAD(P)/FAD-dependent oxidoreductase [Kitasatospora cheerisanensis]|uniref:FAD binding domain protein n=1 Tax=Kitasatospora cheerisanensis KCTC 2395 TaxID=1348663 RepID=A0A066YRJ3_9ACTN|nr:NAD(P)/FAD-dependent oxidoreductase [Kitasatospora cheerisanensis]KDN83857.1 FAD binding domain protein [Kitasatospora cheerisanensis KCTC 2395]